MVVGQSRTAIRLHKHRFEDGEVRKSGRCPQDVIVVMSGSRVPWMEYRMGPFFVNGIFQNQQILVNAEINIVQIMKCKNFCAVQLISPLEDARLMVLWIKCSYKISVEDC